ncbi:MAG: SufD family Fe-S cluster assembly protein [Clostridiales bacterium]|nr:SufD family Fe-S cluster assembly protein [Clostridiales bacterium]
MSKIESDLLLAVSDLHQIPSGAFNIRENGQAVDKRSTENIEIVPKLDGQGIDIFVKDGTVGESLHIPVIITKAGVKELVYNDFHIGKDCDVLIVAGCGIHNTGLEESEHNGIHSFTVGKNSKVRYVEKHLGVGNKGGKILNPVTNIEMLDGSELVMETTQLGGVTSSIRETNAKLHKRTKLVIKEKILTNESQIADTYFNVELVGEDSSVEVISRSVAKENSRQKFYSKVIGKAKSFGHVECDAILMDNAIIQSTPEILAECTDATLVHEAAIGKIAGEQLVKLMTMGLSEKDAEDMIIKGFLG